MLNWCRFPGKQYKTEALETGIPQRAADVLLTNERGQDKDLSSVLSDLCELIEREIEAFNWLMSLLKEQKRIIGDGELEGFKENLMRQEETIAKARFLKQDRINKMKTIALKLSIPSEGLTMIKLIQSVQEQYSSRLKELRDTLITLAGRINWVTKDNRYLIERSLNTVDKNLKIIVGAAEKNHLYLKQNGPKGSIRSESSVKRILDLTF